MTCKSIYKALHNIQRELKAPKNQMNRFGGYRYRSCEDIQEAVKPLLAKYGCILTITDRVEQIGDRYYVTACTTLIDIETGDMIGTTASAREEETKKGMDKAQITGSASSYARKYALNGLFLIDDTKDADTMDNRDSGKEPEKPAHDEQVKPERKPRAERAPRAERSKEATEWLDKMENIGEEDKPADGFQDVQDGDPIPFDQEPAPAQEEKPTRQRRERKRRD